MKTEQQKHLSEASEVFNICVLSSTDFKNTDTLYFFPFQTEGRKKPQTNLKDLKLSTEYMKCFTVGNDPLKSEKGKSGKNIPALHNFEALHFILQNFHPESLL